MINQIELLDGFIRQIVKAKEALFDEFRANYEGLPVDEMNTQYGASYQATQDVLMKCMQILISAKIKPGKGRHTRLSLPASTK